MKRNKFQKIFGVGPKGAAISLLLLALLAWADHMAATPVLKVYTGLMKIIAVLLVGLGLVLHFWAFSTLRHWWTDDKLCTKGPFAYVRHPMYAAWISLICPGIGLYFNSWFYVLWVVLLHPIWHLLVVKEETTMLKTFGDAYRNYAQQAGRFIPKISNP